VVKLKPAADIQRLVATIETWQFRGDDGRLSYYDVELDRSFHLTTIHVLKVNRGSADLLAHRLPAQKAQVYWAEAGIFTPVAEQFTQAAFEQFSQAAYEQFAQAAFEQFSQAVYEQFAQAAFEQFSQAAYEQFVQATYEQFSHTLHEQFSQAVFEQFTQALFEQFSQAAFEQFALAAFEQFSQAAFEQFALAVYERFAQAAFEQFSQALFEQFSQAVFEQFALAAFEQFSQAAFEQFAQAVYEQFAQAAFEQFSQAGFEGFTQAVYEQFTAAAYEAFSLAAYEAIRASLGNLLHDTAFRSEIDKLIRDLIAAYQAEYRAKVEGQAALSQINATAAHAVSRGAGTVVAVIDTGVYYNHWFLQGAIAPGGVDLVDGDLDANDVGDGVDNNGNGLVDEGIGHGTFVAGLVRLVAPDAKILPIRAQDSDGGGWSFLVAEAILYAAASGADVINLSLSIPENSRVIREAVEQAVRSGAVVVAAAGNQGQQLALYPAALTPVIGVAAVDGRGAKAGFSNYGNRSVAVAAPGVELYGPYPAGAGFAWWSGTSFSTALVSGEAALLAAALPGGDIRRVYAVVDAITNSAKWLGSIDPVYGQHLGRGQVDVHAATAGDNVAGNSRKPRTDGR
jgi:hypothetical protein